MFEMGQFCHRAPEGEMSGLPKECERLERFAQKGGVDELVDQGLQRQGSQGPSRAKPAGLRGEDTKRNLKHVGYLSSLVKARRKLLK